VYKATDLKTMNPRERVMHTKNLHKHVLIYQTSAQPQQAKLDKEFYDKRTWNRLDQITKDSAKKKNGDEFVGFIDHMKKKHHAFKLITINDDG
jgi:hypothetical protein